MEGNLSNVGNRTDSTALNFWQNKVYQESELKRKSNFFHQCSRFSVKNSLKSAKD